MSHLRKRDRPRKVLAVCCADMHFSHKAPAARPSEGWYDIQREYLTQLRILSALHGAPIVIAGDVLTKWNETPELINFLIANMPWQSHGIYAIPGNHDLPYHSLKEIERSAFSTLVHAGVITLIPTDGVQVNEDLILYGFPFGVPISPPHSLAPQKQVAVCHQFIWTKKTGYVGALPEQRLAKYLAKLKGYDFAVMGDNHSPFMSTKGETKLINVGAFIRRRAVEMLHKPSVGLLMRSGKIKRHYLDTSLDRFLGAEVVAEIRDDVLDVAELLSELAGLGDVALDFVETIKRAIRKGKIGKDVRKIILEAMESK